MTIIEQNYWKVKVEYLQQSELLVVAKTAEAAEEMVKENVLDTTQEFKVLGVSELTEEEKAYVIKSMQGIPDEDDTETEVPAERTIN